MKKLFYFFFLLVICNSSFVISSCHCKKKATATPTTTTQTAATTTTQATPPETMRDFPAEGYTKARVIKSELDGCNFMLMISNDTKLEPTNLPEEFKKDKTDVWVKYVPKKGGVSVCMAGPIVEVTEILIRK